MKGKDGILVDEDSDGKWQCYGECWILSNATEKTANQAARLPYIQRYYMGCVKQCFIIHYQHTNV